MERLIGRLLRGRISTGLPEVSCTKVHRKKKIILFFYTVKKGSKGLVQGC
jgi:hypothetical protein